MSSAYYHQDAFYSKSPGVTLSLPKSSKERRLVVVSNRLPVNFQDKAGPRLSSGGLVTAMAPVLEKRGGLWIGWPGTSTDEMNELLYSFAQDLPYSLHPVLLSAEEVSGYYTGFANQTLWPLLHGFYNKCIFEPNFWRFYQKANQIFAREVAMNTDESDYIWIHDYHLISVAQKLEELGVSRECGFFLHTPFPSPDIFLKLPWRREILNALMHYSLIGFQTAWDRDNFLRTVKSLQPGIQISLFKDLAKLKTTGHETKAGAFPISIDFDQFSNRSVKAAGSKTPRGNRAKVKMILGVDRLDYSKGIPERLKAYAHFLMLYPGFRGKVVLTQVVVPSRESVAEYKSLKQEIEKLVGRINGTFATLDWTPVHYHYCSLMREELVKMYSQADIALVTPIRDGMNLVAKEYCACNDSLSGVLILSEFAGTAAQLKEEAILINPCDMENVASALYRAATMRLEERRRRMLSARRKIKEQDIFWWLDRFLQTAFGPKKTKDIARIRPEMVH